MMVRDNDEQLGHSTRVGIVEGRLGTLESIMDSMVQELKRLFLKHDDEA